MEWIKFVFLLIACDNEMKFRYFEWDKSRQIDDEKNKYGVVGLNLN